MAANDNDIDGDTLIATAAGARPPSGGVAVLADGTIRYTPPADYSGADEFDYTVSDGHGGTDSGPCLGLDHGRQRRPACRQQDVTTPYGTKVTVDDDGLRCREMRPHLPGRDAAGPRHARIPSSVLCVTLLPPYADS